MMRFAVAASVLVIAINAFNLHASKPLFGGNKEEECKAAGTKLAATNNLGQPAASSLMTNLWEDFDSAIAPLMRMTPSWPLAGQNVGSNKIAFDVKETDKSYELMADIPGVRKEDMEITIRDHVLTLKAERKHEEVQENENYRRVERFRGWLSRAMQLPENAKETDVVADYKDGVLKVTIPKTTDIPKKVSIVPITVM
jgi:HSP20 family molecular chaperone IbpA